MVVDRRITGVPTENVEVESVTVETPDLSIEGVEMTEDGGAILNPTPEQPTTDFFANLAEVVSKDELQRISSKLLGEFEDDKSSRKDWEQNHLKVQVV